MSTEQWLSCREISDLDEMVSVLLAAILESADFRCTLTAMSKETRYRILIILALVIGYIVVAVLRSGTAW